MKPEQHLSLTSKRAFSAYISLILLILFSACASQKKGTSRRDLKKAAYSSRQTVKSEDPSPSNLSRSGLPNSEPSGSQLSRRELKRINDSDEQVIRVISKARSFTGVPYAWGGTTRSGMDCSGLLYTAFQTCGLSIPRTSADQSKSGIAVTLYDLKPGDFVFFAAQKGKPDKITHVGMVTEVLGKHNVQFIHASTKLGVVENNIYSDYYRRIFVKARRLF